MNPSCFTVLQKWPSAQPCCTCFHVMHTTLKLPTWNLPVDWDQRLFYRELTVLSYFNTFKVKRLSLAYLHVTHFKTSRFTCNIKIFAWVLHWAACGTAQFIKWVPFFVSGWYFWEVVVGVRLPALLIFTQIQRYMDKVNVREYPPGIYVIKMNTINY